MDSNSVAPSLPNGGQVGGGVHEHGLSIGQLVGSPAPSPLHTTGLSASGPSESSGVGMGMDVDTPKVERSEDGLRALADAVMGGGPVVGEGSGVSDTVMANTEIHQQELPSSAPSFSVPFPTTASSHSESHPTQHPDPPLLNPLQSAGPPPSSTIVEPSRSPGLGVDSVGGGSAYASPAPVPEAAAPVVTGSDVVMGGVYGMTSETKMNGSYPTPPEVGDQTESNGKRSMDDEEMGDEERYAKRARESIEAPAPPPPSAEVPSQLPLATSSDHLASRPAFQSEPPSEPISAAPSHVSSPISAPAPPAVAAAAATAAPSFPPPPPGHYIPGIFEPPTRPDRGFNMPMTMSQYKAIMNIVRSLKKSKEALAFLHPVDAVALGIPHYPQVIKRPMDLTTVETKLYASNPAGPPKDKSKAQKWDTTKGTYANVNEVIADVRQIWDNCAIFNGPTHNITAMAKNLDDSFEKSVEKVPRDDAATTSYASASSPSHVQRPRSGSISQMPTIRRNSSIDLIGSDVRPKREIHPPTPKDAVWEQSETQGKKARKRPDAQMKWAIGAVSEMMSPKYADCNLAFLEPVNPTLLNIPDYFQVIKKPMDLSTIKHKLASNDYSDVSEVNKDMKQMFANCYTYNPPNTPVNMAGKKLESIWQAKWKTLPAKEVHTKDESEGGSVYDDEGYAEEDAEINAILGQIADLQHRLDVLRKNKARKAKSKASKPSTKHTASYSTPAAKPPKAPKNGSLKPKKASNGVNGSASKKQRRESATIYADDDGEESDGGDVVEQVTLAQKQELADKIQEAGVDVLNQAIQIIQETTTSLGDNGEEIELDIDALPAATVVRLYNLVVKGITKAPKPTSKKPGRRSGPQPHGGNRKKVNDAHEAERIRRMEQQLATFHGASGGGGSGGGGGGVGDDGEEDDVDSQSESEDDE